MTRHIAPSSGHDLYRTMERAKSGYKLPFSGDEPDLRLTAFHAAAPTKIPHSHHPCRGDRAWAGIDSRGSHLTTRRFALSFLWLRRSRATGVAAAWNADGRTRSSVASGTRNDVPTLERRNEETTRHSRGVVCNGVAPRTLVRQERAEKRINGTGDCFVRQSLPRNDNRGSCHREERCGEAISIYARIACSTPTSGVIHSPPVISSPLR